MSTSSALSPLRGLVLPSDGGSVLAAYFISRQRRVELRISAQNLTAMGWMRFLGTGYMLPVP